MSDNFQKLTPINDADIHAYEESLNFVFKEDDIRNVAISGMYGAGKSSVIETYKTKHPEKKFLHISLANFNTNFNRDSNSGENSEANESILEGKILNQLIHQIDPNKIPQTNFRVKRYFSKRKITFNIILVIILILSIVYICNFTKWQSYVATLHDGWVKNVISFFTVNPESRVLGLVIAISISLYLLYKLINIQLNKVLFKKLSVQGNEIELFEECEDSFFDKYLNEVIYLFENSGAEVIVFEDIDRFNSVQVFQRLREINTLVNNRTSKKHTLRFFYLLRDDIFISKDRTKFFDFIIPIVPVVDSSNSYDIFSSIFEESGIIERLDIKFLKGVSLYVDDMRLLKNIYNEFVIYKSRIESTEQDANKFLSIIIYKNLFPRDFSNLQLNRGFVFSLFNSKSTFVKNSINDLEEKINEINKKIKSIKTEILSSSDEVDRLYEHQFYRNWNGLKSEYQAVKKERKDNIKNRDNGTIGTLQNEIKKIQNKIEELKSKKLSEIITRDNIDKIFKYSFVNEIEEKNNFEEIKSSDYFNLLKYLIRNGYIDETYPDYMTYFYEKSISRKDKVFIRSVMDQKAKEYNYKLDNPYIIIENLRDIDFANEEILNFDLLIYLLENINKNEDKLYIFINQLKSNKKFDFILRFSDLEEYTDIFVNRLNMIWPEFFEDFSNSAECNPSNQQKIALLTLLYSFDLLSEINNNNSLSNFIENCNSFLWIYNPKVSSIIKAFDFLDIKFKYICYDGSDKLLWDEVYKNNMYQINWEMIETILENQYNIPKTNDYNHKNLTLVQSVDEPLASYIDKNINEYFELYLDNCGDKILDSENTISYVFNNSELSEEKKEKYLHLLSIKIVSLNRIDNVGWQTRLLEKDLVDLSEVNAMNYFINIGRKYNDQLIKYINMYGSNAFFNKTTMGGQFKEQDFVDFFNETIICNELNNKIYESILESMNYCYDSFSIENIDNDKIKILIDLNIIRMDRPTLTFLREHYHSQIVYFVASNPKAYVEQVLDKDCFDMSEALKILDSNIPTKWKIKMLKNTKDPISIIDNSFGNKIDLYILENNFDKQDIPNLLKRYNEYDEKCQDVIYSLCVKNLENIEDNGWSMEYNLFVRVLSDSNINKSALLKVFSHSVKRFDDIQCKKCLEILEANNFLSLFEGKHPTFEDIDTNRRILNAFEHKGWISSYTDEGNILRAYGRKK